MCASVVRIRMLKGNYFPFSSLALPLCPAWPPKPDWSITHRRLLECWAQNEKWMRQTLLAGSWLASGTWRLCLLWASCECVIFGRKLLLSALAIMPLHCPVASLQYGYHLSSDLTPSPGSLQSPPIAGSSARQAGWIFALCLSALIDWMSLLPVECAGSSAVSQSRRCRVGSWLEPSGLEGSYHSCQITDSLTPPLSTSSYCFFVSQTFSRWKHYTLSKVGVKAGRREFIVPHRFRLAMKGI